MCCTLQTKSKMSRRNYRLVSLLEMFRFDAAAYHQAIYVLTEAIGIVRRGSAEFPSIAIGEKPTQDMLTKLNALRQALEPVDVSVTKIAIKEFEDQLKNQSQHPVSFYLTEKALVGISDTLRRELTARHVFVLDTAKSSYYEPAHPIFGNEVAAKFSCLSYDIAEAGKCLALERSTAAAFHAIRSLEGGITAISRCLGIPDPTKGADRNWGAMLTKIKTETDRRWPSGAARFSGDGKTFEELYGALAGLQNPYRNATMHFDQVYTSEDAKHVFDMVGGLLRKIASRMDENGLPLA